MTYVFNQQYETQYMQTAVSNIAAVLEDELITGKVVRVFRGPASVAVSVAIRPTPGQRLTVSMSRALAAAGSIKALSGLKYVRAIPGNGGVTYEIPVPNGPDGRPMVVTPPLDYMERFLAGRNIPVAIQADTGYPIYLDVETQPNLTAAGPIGSGKSEAIVSALWCAMMSGTEERHPSVIVVSEKRKKWEPFQGTRGFIRTFSKPDDIRVALEVVSANIDDNDDSPLIVIIDDLQALLAISKGIEKTIGRITSAGRGKHMYVWMGTQIMGTREGSGGINIDNNVTFRLVYRMMSGMTSHMATGQGEAGVMDLSGRPGDCIVIDRTGMEERAATPYITRSAMQKLPKARQAHKGIDVHSDWFHRFNEAFKLHRLGEAQRKQDAVVEERLQEAARTLTVDEQQAIIAKWIAPLGGTRYLTRQEVDAVERAMSEGVSIATATRYLYGNYGSHYRAKLMASLEGEAYHEEAD